MPTDLDHLKRILALEYTFEEDFHEHGTELHLKEGVPQTFEFNAHGEFTGMVCRDCHDRHHAPEVPMSRRLAEWTKDHDPCAVQKEFQRVYSTIVVIERREAEEKEA